MLDQGEVNACVSPLGKSIKKTPGMVFVVWKTLNFRIFKTMVSSIVY